MQLANVTPPGPRVTSVTGRAANASANGTTARVSVNSATTASSTIPRVQVSVWRIHYLLRWVNSKDNLSASFGCFYVVSVPISNTLDNLILAQMHFH